MVILDVNVVLAAYRADHPHHGLVRPWVEGLIGSQQDFGVPTTIWASFLRLSTNRRVFPVPSSLAEAFAFVEALIAQPRHLPAEPGPRHLDLVRNLCEEADATGDLVPDAVIGAIAVEHGAVVVSLDRDFARFSSFRHIRPGG
ncbi:MAG: VapC toxin family PIN domain ribonuclease [Acidimicrobiales bacterium]|nr:MAG: VapC toxin family PIN domain ribonuclease [Acidimicrobiales bacterium]